MYLIFLLFMKIYCTQKSKVRKLPRLYKENLIGGYQPIKDQKKKETRKTNDNFFNNDIYNSISFSTKYLYVPKIRITMLNKYNKDLEKSIK